MFSRASNNAWLSTRQRLVERTTTFGLMIHHVWFSASPSLVVYATMNDSLSQGIYEVTAKTTNIAKRSKLVVIK
jgi:hypothetical protein